MMSNEDVLKLADEAGIYWTGDDVAYASEAALMRFSALVERRCAKLCEDSDVYDEYDPGEYYARLILGELP